jgi:hypothetical protein
MSAPKTGKITLSDEELAGLAWIKANVSNHNGACVEIASAPDKIAIRDSKDPGGPILVYTPAEFGAFLDGARNGEFDSLLQLSSRILSYSQLQRLRGVARGSMCGSSSYFGELSGKVSMFQEA